MKVLLDECVPRKFKDSLSGHDCSTVPEEGFAGKKNGELLTLAESAGFQVFLTLDRGIEYQQNLHPRTITVVINLYEVEPIGRIAVAWPRPSPSA